MEGDNEEFRRSSRKSATPARDNRRACPARFTSFEVRPCDLPPDRAREGYGGPWKRPRAAERAELSRTALMEPPMFGLMEPLSGADLGSRTG